MKQDFGINVLSCTVQLQPERAIFHGLSLKFDVSDFRRQMHDNIAAGLKSQVKNPETSHRPSFSRFSLFANTLTKGTTASGRAISTDILEGLPLRLRQ